ncbi:MAG TPA: hypothetical protein VHZ31_08385 [Solirubrobacteraceae bacterium]|nr:hypothetical protein [Solirubrobacteraceae bacterium]
MYAEDILGTAEIIPDGARAGWTFTAPLGTTITAISYYRTLAAHGSRDMAAGIVKADGTVLEQCTIEIPLGSPIDCSKPNNQAPVIFTGLNTTSLFVGVMCRWVIHPGACGTGGTIHSVRVAMYSAQVTLSEGSIPAVTNVGGALWSGGTIADGAPVTFSATDPSGIREESVRSDTGATLVSAPLGCDYTLAQPCPQQPNGSLSVDTHRVPDGPHTFSLVVTDAAGNNQVVMSPTVVVDNDGPATPTAFTATAKGGGSNVIALAWRNPANPPAPITGARVQLCQSECPPAVMVGTTGAAQITAPGPGLYSVHLWLLDAQGRGGPHNAALASVTVSPAGSSAPSPKPSTHTKITAVLSGRRLRVSGTIVRTGHVKVSWRSKLGTHTLGNGSRTVLIRNHKISVTFTPTARARHGTIRIAVRSGRHIVAQARARRSTH